MTLSLLADWLLILFIAGVVFGILATLCDQAMRFVCIVWHPIMRAWSAETQCEFCHEDVHEARRHPIYFQ